MNELETVLSQKPAFKTATCICETKIKLKAYIENAEKEVAIIPCIPNLQTDWYLGYDGEDYAFRYKILDTHTGILYYVYFRS